MSILSWLLRKPAIDVSQPGHSDFRLIGSKGTGTKAVGTSHYQKQLSRLAGPKREYGKNDRLRVLLIEEPDNPYDTNAVQVVFQEQTLGYLPKKAAATYKEGLRKLGLEGSVGNASADIIGGWRDDESEGHYGLRLLYETPLRTTSG